MSEPGASVATVQHGFQATVFLPHWRLGHSASLPERDDAQMAWRPRLWTVWRADGLDSNTSVPKSVKSCGSVNTGEQEHNGKRLYAVKPHISFLLISFDLQSFLYKIIL